MLKRFVNNVGGIQIIVTVMWDPEKILFQG